MTSTYIEAYNEMVKMLNDAWTTGTPAITTYIPDINWQGNEYEGEQFVDKYYATFEVQVVDEVQKTLQGSLDGNGARRYNNIGVVIIDIYAPISISNHMLKLRELSVVARNAFRGKESPSGVVFYNAKFVEAGLATAASSSNFYKSVVTAEYSFDDIS